MAKGIDALEEQFKKLGFPNYKEMLINADHQDEYIFLHAQANLEGPESSKTDQVRFMFVIVEPQGKEPLFLEYITAAIYRKENDETKLIASKGYWYENGPYLNKIDMTKEMLELEMVKKVQQRFNISGESQNTISNKDHSGKRVRF